MNWKAIYKDGSSLEQYDGSENKYTAIDRAKLVAFEMWNNQLITRIDLSDPLKRLIWRRRVDLGGLSQITRVIYLVGWQKTVDGKNTQQIHVIEEDGSFKIIDRWSEENYSPNLIQQEKEV